MGGCREAHCILVIFTPLNEDCGFLPWLPWLWNRDVPAVLGGVGVTAEYQNLSTPALLHPNATCPRPSVPPVSALAAASARCFVCDVLMLPF